jgi:DNA-binding NarL/FixJ family response regulator
MNKIILVDDHSLFREGIKLLIENEGLGQIIAEADNGQAFLELLPNHKPDLVIMDLEMPIINGLEATRKALETYPELKILVLTMLNDKTNYHEIVNAGALGFVLKTSGKQDFEMAIRTITQGGNYFSIEILRQIIAHNSTPETTKINTPNKPKLSTRENEVLLQLCKGLSVTEIAEKLFLSAKTIETHRSTLLKKTNTKNTLNLVLYAIKNHLAEL